jgi:hypothetical protein
MSATKLCYKSYKSLVFVEYMFLQQKLRRKDPDLNPRLPWKLARKPIVVTYHDNSHVLEPSTGLFRQ